MLREAAVMKPPPLLWFWILLAETYRSSLFIISLVPSWNKRSRSPHLRARVVVANDHQRKMHNADD